MSTPSFDRERACAVLANSQCCALLKPCLQVDRSANSGVVRSPYITLYDTERPEFYAELSAKLPLTQHQLSALPNCKFTFEDVADQENLDSLISDRFCNSVDEWLKPLVISVSLPDSDILRGILKNNYREERFARIHVPLVVTCTRLQYESLADQKFAINELLTPAQVNDAWQFAAGLTRNPVEFLGSAG